MFIPKTHRSLIEWHDQLISRLKLEVCTQIRGAFSSIQDPDSIVLFGSHARGNYNWMSDVDLIVIHDYFNDIRVVERGRIFDNNVTLSNVDILCYTRSEYLDAYFKGNPTILDALEHGIILYESNKFFSNLRDHFIEMCKLNRFQKDNIAGMTIWRHSPA